jgi:hypothetical protein
LTRKKYGIVAEPEPPTPPTPTPVTPRTPVNNPREPTYEELKIMYSYNYERIYNKRLEVGDTPEEADEETEKVLRITYRSDPRPLPETTTPTTPVTPTQPDREPTYEELQVMYPDRYQYFNNLYASGNRYTNTPASPEQQAMMIEGILRAEHTDRTQAGTAPPLPTQPTTITITTPAPTGTGGINSEPGTYTAPVATGTGPRRAGETTQTAQDKAPPPPPPDKQFEVPT